MSTQTEYRILSKGEIIQEGDEVDGCRDPWRDWAEWRPAKNIGEPAPDPQYPAHRIYRRKVTAVNQSDDMGQNTSSCE